MTLLAHMGILPVWRWRLRKNEVILNVTTRKKNAAFLTFGCVALAMFLDFICTGTKIPVLHMEMILQADHLGLINTDVLRAPSNMRNETKNV